MSSNPHRVQSDVEHPVCAMKESETSYQTYSNQKCEMSESTWSLNEKIESVPTKGCDLITKIDMTQDAGLTTMDWVKNVQKQGAGEIVHDQDIDAITT